MPSCWAHTLAQTQQLLTFRYTDSLSPCWHAWKDPANVWMHGKNESRGHGRTGEEGDRRTAMEIRHDLHLQTPLDESPLGIGPWDQKHHHPPPSWVKGRCSAIADFPAFSFCGIRVVVSEAVRGGNRENSEAGGTRANAKWRGRAT